MCFAHLSLSLSFSLALITTGDTGGTTNCCYTFMIVVAGVGTYLRTSFSNMTSYETVRGQKTAWEQ